MERATAGVAIGFDVGKAEHSTRRVRADDVVDPLGVSHAPDVIDEYRRAMLAGARFPPPSVVRIGRRFYVADGHKRFQACRAAGASELDVEIWPLRRWLADQAGQARRSLRRQGALLLRSPTDARARALMRRAFWDTVWHWQRIVLSLARLE